MLHSCIKFKPHLLHRLLIFVLLCGVLRVAAQQEPQFTQYMYNKGMVNPAYAGSNDALEIQALFRSQYVGQSAKAISSQYLGFNMPIYRINSGIGLSVINDFAGLQRSTYVSVQYNYRKQFKWGKLSAGIGAGLIQTGLQGDDLRSPDGNYDGGTNHNDDNLPASTMQAMAADVSAGLFLNNDNWFAGVSGNHLVPATARFDKASKFYFAQTVTFSGGYTFNINKKFAMMPSANVKTDFKKVQADIALNLTAFRNFLTGIAFRGYDGNSLDALAIFAGFTIKGVRVVYSYDANLSGLRKFNSGSHEVSAAYILPLKRRVDQGFYYYNPRFL